MFQHLSVVMLAHPPNAVQMWWFNSPSLASVWYHEDYAHVPNYPKKLKKKSTLTSTSIPKVGRSWENINTEKVKSDGDHIADTTVCGDVTGLSIYSVRT